jgi:hypothetical protein
MDVKERDASRHIGRAEFSLIKAIPVQMIEKEHGMNIRYQRRTAVLSPVLICAYLFRGWSSADGSIESARPAEPHDLAFVTARECRPCVSLQR